jgi:hypothetical protein
MRIAFVGDVHGCVFHALGALATLWYRRKLELDAVIQVGDLGAYPSAQRMDGASGRFLSDNPAQGDFFRILNPSPWTANGVSRAMRVLPPVHFVSGNHEDHQWLSEMHSAAGNAPVVPVDPLGVFHHVACGNLVKLAGQRIAFLGRVECPGAMDFDEVAYAKLLSRDPGSVDILVTHECPYGIGQGWKGQIQGSPKLTQLIEHLQPRVHVSGHYHHQNGPRSYRDTSSYALAELVYPKRNPRYPDHVNPEQRIESGSIGILETDTYQFEYLPCDDFDQVCGDHFDLADHLEHFPKPGAPSL